MYCGWVGWLALGMRGHRGELSHYCKDLDFVIDYNYNIMILLLHQCIVRCSYILQACIHGVAEGAGPPPWRLTVTTSLFS